ncbi:hypothetical protein ACKXGF_03635 [Alkalibacillus sp. S2W]|uniref:hypothetical protein n=1 Tax=Alkalibacillus sp. S2W TaxID=3386553 RepID=UPI00398CA47C
MTRYINQERGAILVVVLLTIVFMMFFATVMMNSVLSTANQNEIIETNYRATHVAEMGATFIEKEIAQYIEENEFSTDRSTLNNLENHLTDQISQVTIDEDRPDVEYMIDEGFTVENTGGQEVLMMTVGGYDGDVSQSLTLRFSVSMGSEGPDSLEGWDEESNTVPNKPENPDQVINESVDLKKKNCIENGQSVILNDGGSIKCSPTFNDLYVNNNLSFGNNDTLTVEGQAKFDSLDMTGLSQVFIKRNAHFEGALTSGNNPNSEFLACGNVRLKDRTNYKGGYKVNHYTVSDDLFFNEKGPVIFGDDTLLKNGILLDGSTVTANNDLTIKHNRTQSAVNYLNTVDGSINMAGGDLVIENANGDISTNPDSNNVNYGAQPNLIPECDGIEPPNSGEDSNGSDTSVSLDEVDY